VATPTVFRRGKGEELLDHGRKDTAHGFYPKDICASDFLMYINNKRRIL
jgi:hypothetical protein